MSRINFYIDRQPWGRGVSISMAVERGSAFSVAQPVVFDDKESGGFSPPFVELKLDEAQQLMDELWHCGLRPTEGTGSAGSLAATERHLEDMRRLVFDNKKKGGAA